MPTARGRVLLAFAVAFYVLAQLLSIDELYTVAAAAAVFPLAGVVFVLWARHRMRFTREVAPRRLFAGGSVRITIRARNEAARRSPPLLLVDEAPRALGGPLNVAVPALRRGEGRALTAERKTRARGRFELGPLSAQVVDPLGLAALSTEVAGPSVVTVYPAVETLHEAAPTDPRTSSGTSAKFRLAVQGEEFYGVRGWQDGDDLRKIHWRTSARRGSLMIRQDELRPFPRATVFVDTRAEVHRSMPQGSSFEWALSAAASVVWELARDGFAQRLATSDSGPTEARWGRESTDPLLTALAVAAPAARAQLTSVLRRLAARPNAGGALIAIMPPPTADLVQQVARVGSSYGWAGAILLDVASFGRPSVRERAAFDQRLADADRLLARAGWRVVVAGANDTARQVWQKLIGVSASRPRPSSLRSS